MNPPLSFPEFELLVDTLDYTDSNCMADIVATRLLLEDAYADGVLSLRQWRRLWENVAVVQARYALGQPDAWRHPPAEGNYCSNTGSASEAQRGTLETHHGSWQKADP